MTNNQHAEFAALAAGSRLKCGQNYRRSRNVNFVITDQQYDSTM
jgi:hypothetical protein